MHVVFLRVVWGCCLENTGAVVLLRRIQAGRHEGGWDLTPFYIFLKEAAPVPAWQCLAGNSQS